MVEIYFMTLKKIQKYLETINRQIKDIENLVNEFSDFARMPKPVLKDNNLETDDRRIEYYSSCKTK